MATAETEKGLLAKYIAEPLSSATPKRAKTAHTAESFTETIPLTYLAYTRLVENEIVPYCCRKVSELVSFTSEL